MKGQKNLHTLLVISTIFFVFTVIFTFTGCGSSGSGGSNSGPAPTVASISPTTAAAGSASLALTVTGTGFTSSTVIQVNSLAESTTYVSSTQVTATVPAAQLVSGGQFAVVAMNGTQSSGASTSPALQVTNPVPTLTVVAPTVAALGDTKTAFMVTGTGFVPTTTIQVNGSARTTAYVSATQVTVVLNATDVAALGSLSLTAVNAAPGGGTSTAATVTVVNPLPTISGVSPRTVLTGAGDTTVTVSGSNFVSGASITLNGATVATTVVSSTQLSFTLPNQTSASIQPLKVTNPAPGGGTVSAGYQYVLVPTGAPTISAVTPTQFVSGSNASYLYVYGTNFTQTVGGVYVVTGTAYWNGTALTTSGYITGGNAMLVAQVPASLLTSSGTASITVKNTTSTSTSNAASVTIVDPPAPTLTSITPAGGPVNTATPITLYGTGFNAKSTVAMNGNTISSTETSSSSMSATVPAIALPGNSSITVTTPAPGGGTSSALPFTTYIGIAGNDLVYRSTDGLLYASVPSTNSTYGNSVVGIDPVTGNVQRKIWVGSNPNQLALSTDGTMLFVGLDGAGAVAQVNLSTGAIVNQFSIGGGTGVYNPPNTAKYLAAVPGAANSVAVAATNTYGIYSTGVAIYDSGVARTKSPSSPCNGSGPISFGNSASTLYLISGSNLCSITVDSTGMTASTSLTTINSGSSTSLQYDNGHLYVSNGQVLDASTGTLLGTFYASSSTAASGPVVSDSTLGLAFVGESTYYSTSGTQIQVFNESSFLPTGSIPFANVSQGTLKRVVRWGQNGVATINGSEIYVFQSSLVKDLSSTPADLGIAVSGPSTATTGTAVSYSVKVNNNGPNAAQQATAAVTLDASLIVNSITASQGSCGSGSAFNCNLGSLANGASATVTINATPTTAGTVTNTAAVSSVSYDPTSSNNQASSSTTVTGDFYAMKPALTSISPNLVQSGSGSFTLTVKGSGFNSGSTVNVGGNAMTTTFVSSTQLTANVTNAAIANYGWAPVTVVNSTPGGGTSSVVPLTIYALVNVTANNILYDPFGQQLYASVPSASTTVTGNSVVAINPLTASVGTPVTVGSEPNVMAETSDGKILWVGLKGSSSLAQFNLLQQSLTATIPLTVTQYGSTGSTTATSLAAMPGSDSTLAIGTNGTWGNFAIFDVSGNTGAFRTNWSGIYDGVNPVFADATHLYAYDSQTSGAEFYRYTVNSNGLTLVDGTTLNGMGGFQGGFVLAGGLVFGGGGGIANPSTTPPSQVAKLPLVDFYGTGGSYADEGIGVVADTSAQKNFLLEENLAGTSAYGLVRFNLNTYIPETWVTIPSSIWSVNAPIRWGQDGIAMLATVPNSSNQNSSNQGVTQVMLLRGPFVVPQQLNTGATAATLTSSSSSSLTHGAGNTLLTLTGSNFLPGVAVTWNGNYRTTTIVDSTHVTVAISASDVAAAGSGSLVATNPGASASNALAVTIN